MCAQLDVLKKIREKGKVNGYDVELAEAQCKDYILMNKRVAKIEKDVSSINKTLKKQEEILAKQTGQIESVLRILTSPVEQEIKNGIIWGELKSIVKNPTGKILIIILLGCIALAGEKILQLFHLI